MKAVLLTSFCVIVMEVCHNNYGCSVPASGSFAAGKRLSMKISAVHIRKNYRKKTVLTDVTFSAESGTFLGILGENGCGKSTLLSILAGAQRCDSGQLLFQDGKVSGDLLKDSGLRYGIVGYVPQTPPLLEELTVKDNLRLWYPGGKKVLDKELESGVLMKLGVGDFLGTQVSKLSGGMKKRVSIGCAVASHPKVLILDEPGAALDLVCKQVIVDYLKDFCGKGGIAVMASHEIQEISSCSETSILKGGVLVPYTYDGNIEKLVSEL